MCPEICRLDYNECKKVDLYDNDLWGLKMTIQALKKIQDESESEKNNLRRNSDCRPNEFAEALHLLSINLSILAETGKPTCNED